MNLGGMHVKVTSALKLLPDPTLYVHIGHSVGTAVFPQAISFVNPRFMRPQ